jgi:hypothetical protein
MMGAGSRRASLAAAALVMVSAPMAAEAQGLTLAGGARLYGEGRESAVMAALRSEFPIGSALVLEFASSVADPPEGTARGAASVFEAQLQAPLAMGDVLIPYVGAGAGVAYTYRNGESEGLEGVLSAGAGVRVLLSEQLGVVLDARIRGIGSGFQGEHTDVTLGLRYTFLPRDRPRFRGAP